MMTERAIIQKFRAMPWQPWLKRHFPIFVVYLMMKAGTKKSFAKQGIRGGQFPISLYEGDVWYSTDKMFTLAGHEAEKYLKKTDAFFLADLCLKGYKKAMREVRVMLKDDGADSLRQFKKIITLLEPINVSVWTAHSSEVYFNKQLRSALVQYVAPGKLEKFLGDISFPRRKNAHALMVADILKGMDIKKLHQKYAWLKSRIDAGFSDGYTLTEMKQLWRDILDNPPIAHVRPQVPKPLQNMVRQFQEIVYLRTLRTDALFEIYFRAAPIFTKIERQLHIDSVGNYIPDDLFAGKLHHYGDKFAALKYYDEIVVTKEKIVKSEISLDDQVKGTIAWTGKAIGRVKIVFRPAEAEKVQVGDILVTNMTIPAYLLAMKRAAAFVTDEGGTKMATKILKDRDLVEVDANKGIVRKIK